MCTYVWVHFKVRRGYIYPGAGVTGCCLRVWLLWTDTVTKASLIRTTFNSDTSTPRRPQLQILPLPGPRKFTPWQSGNRNQRGALLIELLYLACAQPAFLYNQDPLFSNGTIHTGLGLPISISYQETAPKDNVSDQSVEVNPQLRFLQKTQSYVK